MKMHKLFFVLSVFILIAGCDSNEVKQTYTISGKITFPDYINSVIPITVNLMNNNQVIASSSEEIFTFSELEEGQSYTVVPQADDSNNGVTTLDRIQIEKFINGEIVLNPFQKLAADVNRDNVIDQADIDQIVNCIMISTCFSWRFYSEDYDGDGSGYVDQFTIPNLVSDVEANFIPIKLGDVNGTAH